MMPPFPPALYLTDSVLEPHHLRGQRGVLAVDVRAGSRPSHQLQLSPQLVVLPLQPGQGVRRHRRESSLRESPPCLKLTPDGFLRPLEDLFEVAVRQPVLALSLNHLHLLLHLIVESNVRQGPGQVAPTELSGKLRFKHYKVFLLLYF